MKNQIFIDKIMAFFLALTFLFFSCEDETKPFPSPGRVIKSFKLESGQVGSEMIDIYNHTVRLTIMSSVDLTSVSPTIAISDGASIFPGSGERIDISSEMSYTYTVTSASGLAQEWTVYFKIADANADTGDYGAYIITSSLNENALGIRGDMLYNDKYWDHSLVNAEYNDARKWQKWHLIFDAEVNGLKYFKIRNLFSGLYLTVPDSGYYQGISICQDQPLNNEKTDFQQWRLNALGDDVYEIVNRKSELLLTLRLNQNGSALATLNLEAEAAAQQWKLNRIPFESYRDVQVQNFFRRNESWMGSVAFDQGNSIPLSWGANAGKILWVTEDAWDAGQMLRPDVLNGNSFFKYNNSILIQPSKNNWNPEDAVNMTNPDTKHPGREYQIMDVPDGLDWTWPGVGLEIGDKVYVYAGEGRGLEAVNDALYILHQNSGTSWKVERKTPVNVGGADGMVRGDDGYVYCYSHEATDWLGYSSNVFVRRYLESDPLLDWTFWDGAGWTTNPSAKAPVATSKATTSVGKVDNVYVMMSMDMGFWCTEERNIYLSYAYSPTGPWSQKVKVYEIEEYINGNQARFYTPILHPYYLNEQNELLLTYCLNFSACGQEDYYIDEYGNKAMNAYYYRLKAIRVPLSLIGL
ncbi:RICIN domain-containing protein [Gaoshiqia sp. Z1-71]|uniref:RICIN domain-containing protein n=1 Tax=Gaoshiqia hydrogeniformans TaxID=3290090 RepID=UPI003BF811DB